MKELYGKHGIYSVKNLPIPEFNRLSQLCNLLFDACKYLDEILMTHRKVYVHCTSGMTRAPTLVILYLCLYCKVQSWNDPISTYKFFKRNRDVCFPNMRAVFKTLIKNRQFHHL